jgi:hypothetical protein
MRKHKLFISLMLLFSINSFAEKSGSQDGSNKTTTNKTEAVSALCAPPSASIELSLNNVRTTIHSGGDMWWDLIGNARYEVPKGSGKHSLYAGSLWMGGIEAETNTLKMAAVRFRQVGNDYWPGPLTENSASVDAETCSFYDRHFKITRAEVEEFAAWYSCYSDPDCNEAVMFPDYGISDVPASIKNWPGNGNTALGENAYLAPYVDFNQDGYYDWQDGDYPFYDLNNEIDCQTDRRSHLYGDETLWWVFNDKGNIHTETGGQEIGMEVRAQAFAFATNDEINDMTFYNYELINRGSFTLNQTYFAQWVDADLGFAQDDYVGCDVLRGLGYCYNGTASDGTGGPGQYGLQPPAVGVDFFEGPFQDNDGIDNAYGIDDGQAINGLGYGDGIIDNERFGMRRFMYHNNDGSVTGDPELAVHYYNLMRGIWKDGTQMSYGGNGHGGTTPADFMFPGNSDLEYSWGTDGIDQQPWSEETVNNTPYDRRFLQSAGPFTLEPGEPNYITVGVVWARASSGGPMASVEKLRLVDDKAQALFENCFKVLDGPDAPTVDIIELDKELILLLSNCNTSNNKNEDYEETDPFIIGFADNVYRFQGYQIFQVKDATVSVSELHNPDKARLVAQCDIQDSISQLINFTFSEQLNASIPVEEVNGENKGIRHSFQIMNDEFANGDKRLVNMKQYHYIAVAYAHNQYKKYVQDDPYYSDGQKKPYLASRQSCFGGAIKITTGVPHISAPQSGGTLLNSFYGLGPELKRMEGQGNGGLALDLTDESIEAILQPPYRLENPVYKASRGPVEIKVVNPLKVPDAEFSFRLVAADNTAVALDTAIWSLTNITASQTIPSDRNIVSTNEQIIEEWGLSVRINQVADVSGQIAGGAYIESSITFAEPDNSWLRGIADADGATPYNWIRSGKTDDEIYSDYPKPPANPSPTFQFYDPDQNYEKIVGGTWAPYKLTCKEPGLPSPNWGTFDVLNKLENLASVDIVITADKSKWSRCPVIEMGEHSTSGGAAQFNLRKSLSIDKEGKPDGSGTYGMGWFPGYAINLETGERLNIMYGEDSFLAQENGRDMKWNPTSRETDGLNVLFGGKHYIYIMGHNGNGANDMPHYDEGAFIFSKLSSNNYESSNTDKQRVYKDAMWVGMPILEQGKELLSSDVTIKVRMGKPYRKAYAAGWEIALPENNNNPLYTFSTRDLHTQTNDLATAESALDIINIVPNPYYAHSGYEVNQLDNRVKLTNLPQRCTVSIYTVNGMLIRKYQKDEPRTWLDWDLKNQSGIPIAGGVYIIHINAAGVGEKTLRWFGALRPVDMDSF